MDKVPLQKPDSDARGSWVDILKAIRTPFHVVALIALVGMTIILAVISKIQQEGSLFWLAIIALGIVVIITIAAIVMAIKWNSQQNNTHSKPVADKEGFETKNLNTERKSNSKMLIPDAGFKLFLQEAMNFGPSEIDLWGYSVHALLDTVLPVIREALTARKKVRVLILSEDSFGLLEKSQLEQGSHDINIASLRMRNKEHIKKTCDSLLMLKETIKYQQGFQKVPLEIRCYNQIPSWRGIYSKGMGMLCGSYMYDWSKPGRTLPHFFVRESSNNDDSDKLIFEISKNWFDYLWNYRSRFTSVDCIVFDLFGTLMEVSPEHLNAVRANMANIIQIEPEQLKMLWLQTLDHSNRGILGSTTERFMQILKLAGKDADPEKAYKLASMEHKLLQEHTELYPETLGVLESLYQRGYKLGLLTNCSPSVIHAITGKNITQYFQVMNFSYQMEALKPEPKVYEETIARLNTSPRTCVFIGDGANNEIEGAKAVGLRTILTTRGMDSKSKNSDYIIEKLDEIPNILQKIDASEST
jgi:putative hydrolase of the HAD superfamily